jgi:hypothetical protein
MSEYQYYEFRAVDRPLTNQQIRELRRYSSRAEITATSFSVEYNCGDFKGNPLKSMEQYFDTFVHVANWGSRWFMFRVPSDQLGPGVVSEYSDDDYLSFTLNDKKHVARLSPNSYVVEVSAVTSTTVTIGTILEFAKLPPVLRDAQHHLFAVAAHPAAFWLMRMYAAAVRTSRPNLHVVKKHAEAWAILGISEPRLNRRPDHADGEA